MGRYRYFESVSVFGIFVGIFKCRYRCRYRYFEIPPVSVSVSVFSLIVLQCFLANVNGFHVRSIVCLSSVTFVNSTQVIDIEL